MKVLIINSVFGNGSTGTICKKIYDSVVEDGHECCVIFGRGEGVEGYKNYKFTSKISLFTGVLFTRLFDLHGCSPDMCTHKVISFIEEYQPDLINIHNLHGYYIDMRKLLTYLSRTEIKIVWTLHDSWIVSGHEAHPEIDENGIPIFSKAKKVEYPASLLFYRGEKNYNFKRKLFDLFSSNQITFVSPSEWLMKKMMKTFLKRFSFLTINNGIDLSRFIPIIPKRNDKIQILCVANVWSKDKGIEIINQLANRLEKEKYEITVVGKVPKKYQLDSSIRFVEYTESATELVYLYSQSTFFFNPTFFDTFPTVNIESLACGTPVVTFNTGGSPEIVDDSCGHIIASSTLEESLKFFLNPTMYSVDSCVNRSLLFSDEVMKLNYLNLFKEVTK